MKEKLIEQIKILEQAQNEAIISQKYEVLVEISQHILGCMMDLETYQ